MTVINLPWIMKKSLVYSLTVILLFLTPLDSLSQKSYSLADSLRIYNNLDMADELSDVNIDSAMYYARTAYKLSRQKNMLRGEGWALLKIAELKKYSAQKDSIEFREKEGLRIAFQLKDDFMQGLAYFQLGQHYMFANRLKESESHYLQSLAVKFEKDQNEYTAIVYSDLGSLFRRKGEFDKEIEWLFKAKRLADKLNDPTTSSMASSSLATAFGNLGNKQEALKHVKEAIAIREKSGNIIGLANSYNNISRMLAKDSLTEAIQYQKKALQYSEQSKVKGMIGISHSTMAMLLNEQGKYADALEYEKKSILMFKELKDKIQEANRSISAANISGKLGDTTGALVFFKNAQTISEELKNKTISRDLYISKANFHKDYQDYRNAYFSFRSHVLYKDSLIKEETQRNIADLQLKYETEKKDNEIKLLNIDGKIRQLEIEKQRAVIRGNLYEAEQKEKAIKILSQEKELQTIRLNHQKEELDKQLLLSKNNEQKIELLRKDQLLKQNQLENQRLLRNSIFAGTGILLLLIGILFNRYQLKKKIEQQQILIDFRNDVAKDLHDDIGSTLTSIKILSEVSRNNLVKDQVKAGNYLDKITEQSAHMQQEMSDIVWAIKPDNDKLANMLVKMREFVSYTLEPKNIRSEFIVDDAVLSNSLSMQHRRDFFLIFKEAINNAAKYSSAKLVKIYLQTAEEQILLSISDDGIGFNPHKETSSNGLKNMNSRALALNGTLDVISSPGEGTVIVLSVPIC